MVLPMGDVKILDLTTQLPGPYCSMLLGDLGAEIIKLERPGSGDSARFFPRYFQSVNRNKKSCTLNLRADEGRGIFLKLAAGCDVVIEGFRPGVAARLRIDYDAVKEVNEGIIYCSISGYGQEGPYQQLPGYDINYQGVAGLLRVGLPSDAPPRSPDIWIGDMSSGMFAAMSILAALLARGQTGEGQYIDVSMTEGLISWAAPHAGFEAGDDPEPAYGVFETGDYKYITLGVSRGEPFWEKMWGAFGYETPPDAHSQELKEIIASRLKEKTAGQWLEILREADVPCGPVHDPKDSLKDPQIAHRGVSVELEGTQWGKFSSVRYPALFSRTPAQVRWAPPTLGEQTEEIVSGLGYSPKEIEKLRDDGVI